MGSYIDLGFVSQNSRQLFMTQCLSLLCSLESFTMQQIKFPVGSGYKDWAEYDGNQLSLTEALEHCCAEAMAEIKCSFALGEAAVENALICVKHMSPEPAFCMLIAMPEANPIFRNIDGAESAILQIIQSASPFGFDFAFCDSEADAPCSVTEFDQSEQYSVFAGYEPELNVSFRPWKIDGISER